MACQALSLFVFNIFKVTPGVTHSQAPKCKCVKCHEVPSAANYQNCYLINSVYPTAQSCKCIILIFNTKRLIVILNCYVVHGGRGNMNVSALVTEGFSIFEIGIGQLLCNLAFSLINM